MGNYLTLADWAKACSEAINQIKGTTYKMAPRHFPKIIDEIEFEGLPSGLDSTTAPPQLLPLMSDIANSIRRKCSCDDCRVNRKRIKPNDFPTHILKINNTSECTHDYEIISQLFGESPFGEGKEYQYGSSETYCTVEYRKCTKCGDIPSLPYPDNVYYHMNVCDGTCTICGASGGYSETDPHNFDLSPYDYYFNSDATCNYCGALHNGVWRETGDGYTWSDPMCCYVQEYCADHPGHERNRIDIPCNVGSDGICTSCGRTHSVCSGGYDCIHDWQGNNVMDENGNWTGEIEYICSNCGAGGTFNETWNPPSTSESSGGCHFTLVETYPATCVRQGVKIYQCSDCQATRIQMLSPIDHNLVFIEAIDSTCTRRGYTKYKCSHCNNIFEEEIPIQDHIYVNGDARTPGVCKWCNATCPHDDLVSEHLCACGYDLNTDPRCSHSSTYCYHDYDSNTYTCTCFNCDLVVAEGALTAVTYSHEGCERVADYECPNCGRGSEGLGIYDHDFSSSMSIYSGDCYYFDGTYYYDQCSYCSNCGTVDENNYDSRYLSEGTDPNDLRWHVVDSDSRCIHSGDTWRKLCHCETVSGDEGTLVMTTDRSRWSTEGCDWTAPCDCPNCGETDLCWVFAGEYNHNFSSGICTKCGASDPDYEPCEHERVSMSIYNGDDYYYDGTYWYDQCYYCKFCGVVEGYDCRYEEYPCKHENTEEVYYHWGADPICFNAALRCTDCGMITAYDSSYEHPTHYHEYENGVCKYCPHTNEEYEPEETECEHENANYEYYEVEPTCTTEGIGHYYCPDCGAEWSASVGFGDHTGEVVIDGYDGGYQIAHWDCCGEDASTLM